MQRYAYDFAILDSAGNSFQGEETEAGPSCCYGRDILASADDMVAKIYTGNPDSRIIKSRTASRNTHDTRGNYVLIYHFDGEYSLLAHLKPDNIWASMGQSIKRGEKIAECGDSRDTSEPRLHFQVQLGEGFYFSSGLPVEFESIKVKKTLNYEKFNGRYLREYSENYYPPFIGVGQTIYDVNIEGWDRDSII